jgi:hypothetical protein
LIEDVKSQIVKKKEGSTHKQVIAWLQDEGIQCSRATLECRLREWGVRRNTATPANDILIQRVGELFHRNLLSDSQIAGRISEEDGFPTTTNQIQ